MSNFEGTPSASDLEALFFGPDSGRIPEAERYAVIHEADGTITDIVEMRPADPVVRVVEPLDDDTSA